MVRWAPVALVLAASGCAALAPQAWHRTEPPSVVKHPYQEKRAQVWMPSRLEVWHALIITPDSITGIPAELPAKCDNCRRRSIAWADADSVRFQRFRPLQTSLLVVALLIALAFVPH
jgi:hypothetical protein